MSDHDQNSASAKSPDLQRLTKGKAVSAQIGRGADGTGVVIMQASATTSAADDEAAHQLATIESDRVDDMVAGVEALNARADELLAVAERAARMAIERGDEIDAMLIKVREVRAEMALA